MADTVRCADCRHFRSAPYEARKAGCYFPGNMTGRQKDAFLDEQQVPGDHERINRNGDCPDFERRAARAPLFQRLFEPGA